MKVLDKGHQYELASFDGGTTQVLTFVKRNQPPGKYPGNTDAYPGTQTQEVLRALIDRAKYVNAQTPCMETTSSIDLLRQVLYLYESRHAHRHQLSLPSSLSSNIEEVPFCVSCGHLVCAELEREGQ